MLPRDGGFETLAGFVLAKCNAFPLGDSFNTKAAAIL